MSSIFLFVYTLSGVAGLIYEVCWTRLLTQYIGHTTAAASTVVAAFMGGLALGASAGGALASRLSPRHALRAYALLELLVVGLAVALPFELVAVTPLLGSAYQNGDASALFPVLRLGACLVMITLPAVALGATFPMAIRWFARTARNVARASGTLYAANTIGAATGSLLAGFVFIPSLGISASIRIGVLASIGAAAGALVLYVRSHGDAEQPVEDDDAAPRNAGGDAQKKRSAKHTTVSAERPAQTHSLDPRFIAAGVLALSGFGALLHEIAWTRILALVLGPTIYAFSAAVAAVIAGTALGSSLGTWIAGRSERPGFWLALVLTLGALATTITAVLAGGYIPRSVAQELTVAPNLFDLLVQQTAWLSTSLVLPTSACLGAAFPLALALCGASNVSAPRRFGSVYAINTLGAVSGSLAAGFFFIPRLGLQPTLSIATACFIVAALIVLSDVVLPTRARIIAVGGIVIASAVLLLQPAWDRELLASGVYLYAPDVPPGLDREALLKAGDLLYYREGAAATVSVKRLTGTTTLAVDGKVDASNRRDMLTQKLIAHLPLLIHRAAKKVAIVGLGSGATAGAALQHPVERVDVIEISPEVVEASQFFVNENRHALSDPRLRMIVGDGRSHLLLSDEKYDVIISEPSNPWIAGVAALFTEEFFAGVKARLTPDGIVCQWAHTYNISDADLRRIVSTFRSVFPEGTAWLVGGDDVLLIASNAPLADRISQIANEWPAEAAADLDSLAVRDPFSLLSLYAAGPQELARYTANAEPYSDDRMTLEFSAPRELRQPDAAGNSSAIESLFNEETAPIAVRTAKEKAGATEWRNRAAMLAKSDVDALAYDDYIQALQIDASDTTALDGLVTTALVLRRASDGLAWVKAFMQNRPPSAAASVAMSRLMAASGAREDAIAEATRARALAPSTSAPLEQLAELYADASNTEQLAAIVDDLKHLAPTKAATHYYSAALALLGGQLDEAVADGNNAVAADPSYAAVYDLLGAAHTKRGDATLARQQFLTSLRFNAHDSTAYTNLGVLELAAGNRDRAANYFAEALWLEPDSVPARAGLSEARAAKP
ncbi:MAG: fused MFS/spermidine synthase [Acidobacteriaceae bacterium]|nr:fused MFS/spermidine synthase [Acidobacteriaceae bacterium]